MVAAAAAIGNEQDTIHSILEVDVSEPRRVIREHMRRTGERLSFTAFIVTCLVRAIADHPHLNSFRKGRKLILLDDITVSVLVERDINGEKVPEPLGIQAAQTKTLRQIHNEIRTAQQAHHEILGALSGIHWFRFIPHIVLRLFIRAASRSISMGKRYGKVAVTAIGMFGNGALWFVPVGGGTVVVTVGSIVDRPLIIEDKLEAREHLCLTISFNHEIIDGAPAARFISRFSELLRTGNELTEWVAGVGA
jgi:pyruvate/2-oxoglutarate dehydrogenase complex dihydrolipoamide acyltransferase (E2) component